MELINVISTVGFPIAITIYLLITRDKVIMMNTDALQKLTFVVEMYHKDRFQEREENKKK